MITLIYRSIYVHPLQCSSINQSSLSIYSYLATQLFYSPVVLDQQYPQITDYTHGVSSSVYTAGQRGGSLQWRNWSDWWCSRDVGSNLGLCGGLFYDDMLECTTMATWYSRSLNSTMTLSGGHITVMIKYSIHSRVKVLTKVYRSEIEQKELISDHQDLQEWRGICRFPRGG